MGCNWNRVLLSDCLMLVIDHRGKTPKKLGGDWAEKGYRAISAKNIKTGRLVNLDSVKHVNSDLYRKWMPVEVARGDIFVTSEAPFGQVYFWDSDEKIVLSQRIFGLRVNTEKCHPLFLYYWMCSREFQSELANRATGTTVIGLRQPELMKCSVRLPDFQTQEKVASFLRLLDIKINLNNRINDYLVTSL